MRILPIAAAMLALSACSDEPGATEAPASTAPANAMASEAAASASESPEANVVPSASPSASPAPTPAPSASATPAAKATPAAAPTAPSSAAAMVAAAAAPPASFGRCVACHDASKGGADKLGPNLYKVYGGKAGVGSYAFSDALKASGLTWTDATLDKWLENPRALVPGTTMSFPGLKDPAKRAEIIVFLKSAR
ncbi:cytochrome c [Novosphingobium kunmingense]|uniref:Cytochrome c n=1 Tax=Novosphingobium kunmingense TaxID=1211806 RepID=A0A2N0H6D8_9SPHN|nr:c-type cytochrome [Novosphingobium kunmingense]PKB14498.1 cytochrome c [Novosphingobium kunmingense]